MYKGLLKLEPMPFCLELFMTWWSSLMTLFSALADSASEVALKKYSVMVFSGCLSWLIEKMQTRFTVLRFYSQRLS